MSLVLRDDLGDFIACKTVVVDGFYDVDEILEALSWVLHLGLEHVIVESDFQNVRHAFCDANVVAHALARVSQAFDSPFTWVEPPTFVDALLSASRGCIS
ncbi:hypothetical protein ACS0TY_028096 [Phlomoides rotata]